jgi:hypothetical protein
MFNWFRKITGNAIGCIGALTWVGGGLITLFIVLKVMFEHFGVWTIFVGLLFAPITWIASILIVWFTENSFPWYFLVAYGISFGGLILAGIGSAIKGED